MTKTLIDPFVAAFTKLGRHIVQTNEATHALLPEAGKAAEEVLGKCAKLLQWSISDLASRIYSFERTSTEGSKSALIEGAVQKLSNRLARAISTNKSHSFDAALKEMAEFRKLVESLPY